MIRWLGVHAFICYFLPSDTIVYHNLVSRAFMIAMKAYDGLEIAFHTLISPRHVIYIHVRIIYKTPHLSLIYDD